MIAFLFKNWKLFIDILIVVGAIILLTIFDPFNMFSKSSLNRTANLVSSVKEIGELVTAEYYGEVISSLLETKIYDLPQDSLYENFEECFYNLKYSLSNSLIELQQDKNIKFFPKQKLINKVSDSKILDTLKKQYQANNIYSHLFAFLAVNYTEGKASKFISRNNELTPKAKKVVIKKLVEDLLAFNKLIIKEKDEFNIHDYADYINSLPGFFTGISDFHYTENKDFQSKWRNRNKDIVFIGRGWVKAGFKFNQLDESNFYYNKDAGIIRFYGLKPCILDKDINPWFIPEKKIKGFELVDFYKKADFKEAKIVKKKCKEKLLAQAQKADILGYAQKNGEEALKNFFSLLLDKPDLIVEFVDLPFEKDYEMIAADTIVTVKEALLIADIYKNLIDEIESLSISEKSKKQKLFTILMNKLSKLDFIEKGYPFNLFSIEAAKILDHKLFITEKDYDSLRGIRGKVKNENDTLCTEYVLKNNIVLSYPFFLKEFNSTLKILEKKAKEVDPFRVDSLKLNSIQMNKFGVDTSDFFIKRKIKNADTKNPDTFFIVIHKKNERNFNFENLRYLDVKIISSAFDTLRVRDTVLVDSILELQLSKSVFTSKDSACNERLKNEFQTIKKYESDRIKCEIKTKPIRNITEAIRNIFN